MVQYFCSIYLWKSSQIAITNMFYYVLILCLHEGLHKQNTNEFSFFSRISTETLVQISIQAGFQFPYPTNSVKWKVNFI